MGDCFAQFVAVDLDADGGPARGGLDRQIAVRARELALNLVAEEGVLSLTANRARVRHFLLAGLRFAVINCQLKI